MIQQTQVRLPESAQAWGVLALLVTGFLVSVSYGYELFALLGAAALLALFAYGSPRAQIGFLVLFLPLEYQGLDVGFANLGPYDLVVDFFVLIIAARFLYEGRLQIQKVYFLAIVMFLMFLPSVISTASSGTTAKELARLIIAILTAHGISSYLSRERDFAFARNILRLIVIETAFLAVYSMYNFYSTANIFAILRGRIQTGLFNDVNYYGTYLIMVTCIAMGLAFVERKLAKKVMYWVICGLMTTSLILTFSRAGLVALLLVIVFSAAFHSFVLRRGIRVFSTVGAVVLGGIIFFSSTVGQNSLELIRLANRFETVATGKDASLNERLKILNITWKVISANPIVGVGFGAYEDSFDKYRGSQIEVGSRRDVHNSAMRILAETGIVGFTGAFIFIVGLLRHLWKRIGQIENRRSKTILFSLFLSIVSFLITSFTLDQFLESHCWVFIGLATGMASLPEGFIEQEVESIVV